MKLAVIWSAEGRDEKGVPVRDPGSITYSAAIESVAQGYFQAEESAFASRVNREAERRGYDQVPSQVVLGDGAVWRSWPGF